MKYEALVHIPTYDCGSFILRPIRFDDYEDMFEYGSDQTVTSFLSWPAYRMLEDAKKSVEQVFLSRPKRGIPLAHAIEDKATGKMIGTCDFHTVDFHQKTGEIGFVLHRDYWSKGIMSQACAQIIRFGFDYLKLETVFVKHLERNVGSKRVIEKNHFRYVKHVYDKHFNEMLPCYEISKDDYLLIKESDMNKHD